ncbi:MAG: FMN-binding protein [bacterium]|nr:FMN-binding protein [bacterium]
MKRIVLSILILWVLCVVTGPITASELITPQLSQRGMFPHATTFNATTLTLDKSLQKAIKKQSKVRISDTILAWKVINNSQLVGWYIVDNVIGKHEFITYAVGLNTNGEVIGLDILAYRENYGQEVAEPKWTSQFLGKTKSNTLKLGQDIDIISGATLSSRNITNGVRKLLIFHDLVLTKK